MLTYGDGVSNVDLKLLLNHHKNSENTVTLTAIQPGGRFGVLGIDGDSIIAFQEKSIEAGGWINAGFMVAESELFDYIADDGTILEREPLELLSSKHKLGVYKHYGYWQCMDSQRDKVALEKHWESGNALWKIWKD
jgi:glucose-1-phosphate cytidylyltransferase